MEMKISTVLVYKLNLKQTTAAQMDKWTTIQGDKNVLQLSIGVKKDVFANFYLHKVEEKFFQVWTSKMEL